MSVPRITQDGRRIVRIRGEINEWEASGSIPKPVYGSYVKHGDRIEAYEEPGQGAMVPWFVVYVGDEIRWRIPAHMVTVEYADE